MKKGSEILHTDQPVPTISGNIATRIVEKLNAENYDYILEYGSGNSTRFFIAKLIEFNKQCSFISIEYNQQWFTELTRVIQSDLESNRISNEKLEYKPWDYEKCRRFFYGENATALDVPDDLKRLNKAKRRFAGPLNSKLLLYKLHRKSRPLDAVYQGAINESINLQLVLRSELIKDQYGESPIKDEYIGAGLAPLKHILASPKRLAAAFIIDGGPRSDILEAIFNLEDENDNFFPTIFLCDANRVIYLKSIGRRPGGEFWKGSNQTLNYESLYKNQYSGKKANFFYGKDTVTSEELLNKEIWFYQREVD
ncbi:MAG: hypothetical protein PVF38_17885 [Desulfobacterales bacterium]|jgi:hypothetical protein